MGPHRHTAPLSVVHSDADPGRSGMQLFGELDVSTVALLEDELTRRDAPPSFIDLSQLHFLDLTGLRALLRAVESDVADTARLVGATGVVRRLIELTQRIDGLAHPPAPSLRRRPWLPSLDVAGRGAGSGRLIEPGLRLGQETLT
jgi:anti-anti-sigma factor